MNTDKFLEFILASIFLSLGMFFIFQAGVKAEATFPEYKKPVFYCILGGLFLAFNNIFLMKISKESK